MTWLSVVSSLLSLLRWVASFVEGEKNRQAGRDEVAAKVNKEAADAYERMAKVPDNPGDDDVADRMRHGRFFHGGQDRVPNDQTIRSGDTRSSVPRIPTFGGWFRD